MNIRSSLPTAGFLLIAVTVGACAGTDERSDAYGNFEAAEVLVSAETAGRILQLGVSEGQHVARGSLAAVIDTVQLVLRRDQLTAQRAAIRSRLAGISAQIDVLGQQRQVAMRELERVSRLVADGAATAKQLDDVQGQLAVLDRQIDAVRTQNGPVLAEMDVVETQQAQLDDQIARSRVLNPIDGTVLVTYAEESELTSPGRPLYRVARLDTLTLRAYVSGAQLPHLTLGSRVDVIIDEDETTNRTLDGQVTWISSEAEFTPKPIQTKEERVNLVYAFKVQVANPDGVLKIGMPGEVMFRSPSN